MRDAAERRRGQARSGRAPRWRRCGPVSTGEELPAPWVPPAATAIPEVGRLRGTYEGDDGRIARSWKGRGWSRGLDRVGVGPPRTGSPRRGSRWILPGRAPGVRAGPARVPSRRRRGRGRGVPRRHVVPRRGVPGARARANRRRSGAGIRGSTATTTPGAPCSGSSSAKGRLAIFWPTDASDEEGGELTPLDDGSFAVGDPALPRRVRFEGDVRGMTAVVVCNGGRWYRSFEE